MPPNWHRPARRMLVGNTAGVPAPAWKHKGPPSTASTSKASGEYVHLAPEPGSKLLISLLPIDVDEEQVITLCEKTIGPVKGVFMIYNNQGGSKGMAVVHFQRKEDAMKGRTMYNHKVIDGKRPIRCELILDQDVGTTSPPPPQAPPTLLSRLNTEQPSNPTPRAPPRAPQALRQKLGPSPQFAPPPQVPNAFQNTPPSAPHRMRIKKGAKRLKKRVEGPSANRPQTMADLDKELEEWRASGPRRPA